MELRVFDFILVSVLVLALPVYGTWEHRRLVQELDLGRSNARLKAYVVTMSMEWLLSLIVISWWVFQRRALSHLGLAFGGGLGWKIGGALTLIACVLLVTQTLVVIRSRQKLGDVQKQIEPLKALIPRDGRELRAFSALSITAGVCEELLFRGFLLVFLTALLGTLPAVALSSLAFGAGHAYQGVTGILKTGGVGLVLAGLFLLTGSLWPPMLLHAMLDVNSGYLGYRALGLIEPEPDNASFE